MLCGAIDGGVKWKNYAPGLFCHVGGCGWRSALNSVQGMLGTVVVLAVLARLSLGLNVLELTDSTFEREIKSAEYAIVAYCESQPARW